MIRSMCLSAWLAIALVASVSAETIELDRPFLLKAGEYATWKGNRLRLMFVRVVQDSRCPEGEQCIVAGTATLRILVEVAGMGSRELDLRLPDRASAPVLPEGPHLLLKRLDPYPIGGRSTSTDQYLATLVLRTVSLSVDR
jgi:hypothetical protein